MAEPKIVAEVMLGRKHLESPIKLWISSEKPNWWSRRRIHYLNGEHGRLGPYRTETEARDWLAVAKMVDGLLTPDGQIT